MSTILQANNSAAAGQLLFADNSDGVLLIKTGKIVSTTAISIDENQNVTFTKPIISPPALSPTFSGYASGTGQVIAQSTNTKININTIEFDTTQAFNTSTSQYNPKVAGYYMVNGCTGNNIGTSMYLSINKNLSTAKIGPFVVTNANNAGMTALIYMNGTTDYLELHVFSTGGITLYADSQHTYFQAYMVKAA